jgi:hypothetical protein
MVVRGEQRGDPALVGVAEHACPFRLTENVLRQGVHINTLLVQAVLEVPEFHHLISLDERRALTPLSWV